MNLFEFCIKFRCTVTHTQDLIDECDVFTFDYNGYKLTHVITEKDLQIIDYRTLELTMLARVKEELITKSMVVDRVLKEVGKMCPDKEELITKNNEYGRLGTLTMREFQEKHRCTITSETDLNTGDDIYYFKFPAYGRRAKYIMKQDDLRTTPLSTLVDRMLKEVCKMYLDTGKR